MRFVTRILAGLSTAAVLAVGVVAGAGTASASAAAPVKAQTATTTPTQWGPYFSDDHKAKAAGEYVVKDKVVKVWYWKKWYTWHVKCWKDHGEKVCKKYKKFHKKWTWKPVHVNFYTVHSTLWNFKWFPYKYKYRCAWETFKVLHKDGKFSFHTFRNCPKSPKDFSFTVKNVDKIWVNVARGNPFKPLAHHSGWQPVV